MKQTELIKKIVQKCEHCGMLNHSWHEVYYEQHVTLKKADKTYIAWCNKIQNYVLINKIN